MSDTILTGDFTVYYTNETGGDKQIRWTGTTGFYSVRQLYTALQDLFDNATGVVGDHMEEGIPIQAVTPTQYNVGRIETNDSEPWFVDHDTIQHLMGGSIASTGWTRSPYPANGTGTVGIIRVEYSVGGGTDFAASDIGKTITHSAGDSGTLLHFNTDGSAGDIHIRPDSNALANDWDSTGTSMSVTGGTGSGLNITVAGITGEDIYSNLFTIGTIKNDTQIYIIKDNAVIETWWGSGHIDVLINIQEAGVLFDFGILSVFARQYTGLYDHFVADVSLGGRNPIPLATSDDINNVTGYRSLTGSSGVSDFDVGNYIYAPAAGGWAAATKKGVITQVTGTIAAPVIEYYLIGDLTDFVNTDTLKEYDPGTGANGDGSATVNGAPTNTGIAALTGITYTFGATSANINNGNGNRPYNVTINCGGNTIQDFYEHTKYVTRRGYTGLIDGEEGQQYIGSGDIYLYMQTDGGFTEALKVTGGTSGATGWIVADHTYNPYYLTLRDVRGTFANSEIVTDTATGTATTLTANAVEQITLSKVAPFGSFAGGKFFGTRGVHIYNMSGADSNNYSLFDSENVLQTPPATIAITVNGVVAGDRVAVFRATGDTDTVDKSMFNIQQTHTAPVAYIRVSESIPLDTPTAGTIRVVRRDGSGNILGEERYDYTAFSNANQPTYSEFTLSGTTTSNYDTDDTAYVPYLDVEATGTSVSTSVQYVTNRYVTTRVRRKGILPFIVKGELTTSGFTAATIRTHDTIVD